MTNLKEKIKKISSDFSQRAICSAIFSLAVNLIFIAYNAYLGIKFAEPFAIGISIYYLVLFLIMLSALITEGCITKKLAPQKAEIRARMYSISSIFIFFIDLCLIAPIILMMTRPKDVSFGLIPAISMAAYCCYKVVIAIINYKRSKKSQNPTVILLKEINIIGAILSILNLQHTLIMVNGGMNEKMRTLSLLTSIGFIAIIIAFSILSFIRNKRLFKAILPS